MRVYKLTYASDENGDMEWAVVIPALQTDEAYRELKGVVANSIWSGQPPRLSEGWRPPGFRVFTDRVRNKHEVADLSTPSPFGDFLMVSQRAVAVLGEALRRDGELLPLDTAVPPSYYLFNVTRLVDALDMENTLVDSWLDEPEGLFHEPAVFAFHPERLQGVGIFVMKPLGLKYYCTDAFKAQVEASGLRSTLHFLLVWDSENPDFVDERYKGWDCGDYHKRWQRAKHDLLVKKGLAEPPPPPKLPPRPAPTVEPFDPETTASKDAILENSLALLQQYRPGLDPGDEPQRLVEAAYQVLDELRRASLDTEAMMDRAVELGLLWGEQACRAYGWRWAMVDGGHAVVAPDNSAYVEPVTYAYGLLFRPEEENTFLLLFNLLGSPKKMPRQPGGMVQLG